jgi:hypothetical protein
MLSKDLIAKIQMLTRLDEKQLRQIKKIVSTALNETAQKAKFAERNRCYRFALHCRDRFKKRKDLPQDIVVATEVVAEGILNS